MKRIPALIPLILVLVCLLTQASFAQGATASASAFGNQGPIREAVDFYTSLKEICLAAEEGKIASVPTDRLYLLTGVINEINPDYDGYFNPDTNVTDVMFYDGDWIGQTIKIYKAQVRFTGNKWEPIFNESADPLPSDYISVHSSVVILARLKGLTEAQKGKEAIPLFEGIAIKRT